MLLLVHCPVCLATFLEIVIRISNVLGRFYIILLQLIFLIEIVCYLLTIIILVSFILQRTTYFLRFINTVYIIPLHIVFFPLNIANFRRF